jgi:phospholipase/carboxylesterase
MSVFDHLERAAPGGRTDAIVIILHGYGSNAERSMAQAGWLGEAFPNAHVYAPNGTVPYVPIMDPKSDGTSDEPVPDRYVWYHRYSEKTRREGLAVTLEKLESYVNECRALHGLDRSRVAMVGLSQGAIATMNCVPFFREPIGAAVPHSGYLFSPDSTAQRHTQVPELKAATLTKTPMCIIHGMLDFTLPWQTALETANLFDEMGIPVEFHLLSGLRHANMDERSQKIAAEFIARHLYAQVPETAGATA